MSNSSLRHQFKPFVINHSTVKCLPNPFILVSLISPSEVLTIVPKIYQTTSTSHTKEMKTLIDVVRYLSLFFISGINHIKITNGKPRFLPLWVVDELVP